MHLYLPQCCHLTVNTDISFTVDAPIAAIPTRVYHQRHFLSTVHRAPMILSCPVSVETVVLVVLTSINIPFILGPTRCALMRVFQIWSQNLNWITFDPIFGKKNYQKLTKRGILPVFDSFLRKINIIRFQF